MGTVKVKTNSRVKMRAPINTVEELDKVIKFLTAERDALLKADGKQPKKKVAEAIKADLNTGFEAARARV